MATILTQDAEHAQRLARQLLDAADDPADVKTVASGAMVAFDVPDALLAKVSQEAPADVAPTAGPPKRNASREDWAEWLAEHTPIVTEGKDRAELLAEYDALER